MTEGDGKTVSLAERRAEVGSPALEQRSDDELMLLTRGGNRKAFSVLVRRHQLRALNLAHRYLADTSLAQDAAQNAFVEVYRYLPRYRAEGKFRAFLCRVLIAQCAMLGRSTTRRRRMTNNFAVEPHTGPDLPDSDIIAQERHRHIVEAVAELSPKLRSAVVLRYSEGLALSEVAEVLEVPVGTVKSRLASAMEKLRAIIVAERK